MNRFLYSLKPLLPRRLQLLLRRELILYRRRACRDVWPINPAAGGPPQGWPGWPHRRRFALVLTHDVETEKGCAKCNQLTEMEESLGFRSSFNFVPERYQVPDGIRCRLVSKGFEVGVHGLYHDGRLYSSEKIFRQRAVRINHCLRDWQAVGFRSPAMHHKLEWLHGLDIEYDASTFDTDPFEPQSDGVGTVFPFWVQGPKEEEGYVELPYTLPQDFTLFVLMKEANIDIWRRKLEWIAGVGGMALLNVHPDYIAFGGKKPGLEEYPAANYAAFLEHTLRVYPGQYWHVLPRDMARFWSKNAANAGVE